jgi:protein-tyrosine sulfotransferase
MKVLLVHHGLACYSTIFSLLAFFLFIYQIRYLSQSNYKRSASENELDRNSRSISTDKNSIEKIRESPIIFVSGYRRSGTTLMRSILDVHDSIFCGPELKALSFYIGYLTNLEVEAYRYNYYKTFFFNMSTVYDASVLFMHHILKNNLRESDILCAKDPTFIYNIDKLNKVFPKAKVLIMVRDGRGSVYSLIQRSKMSKMTAKNFYDYLVEWNSIYFRVYNQCNLLGKDLCKIVRYEDLIDNTEEVMKDVSSFLNIKFTKKFLNHQKFIGDNKKVVIEKNGLSSYQVIKPVYKSSLKTWVGKVDYNKVMVNKTIYMLHKFGYKIDFNNPNDGIYQGN